MRSTASTKHQITKRQILSLPALVVCALLTTVASSPTRGETTGWRSGPFSTQTGGSLGNTIALHPASTHVCVLTRISGKFQGGGESAGIFVAPDGVWYLKVENQSDQKVFASAHCFRKDGFLANGPLRRRSPQFEARGHHAVSAWNGHAATFIAGVNGHLRGGGEHARIDQSLDVSTPSKLRVGSAAGYLRSWAYSFFAGTLGAPAKFHQGKEFTLDHVNIVSPRSVDMAPVEKAMCYFTRLQGKFDGGGEWAEIVPAFVHHVWRWRLRAQARGESEVFAAARCYLRDQR
jgi:hypothetical protein